MRFCTAEVLRDRALRVTELGCVPDSGFRSARVRGARKGRVRFAFRRRYRTPVTVVVRRARRGPAGPHGAACAPPARFHVQAPAARRALRGVLHRSRAHRQGRSPRRGVHRVAARWCPPRARLAPRVLAPRALWHAALGHAAVAGVRRALGRPLRLRYTLRRRARVSLALLRGRRVVRRLRPRPRRAGTRRAAFRASGLPRGVYRVRLVVRAGGRRSAAVLAARRL